MKAGDPIDDLIDAILLAEGWPAFTDRAADRGGPTKGGITLKTLTDWRLGRFGTTPGVEDLKNLSEREARDIYRRRYVAGPGFDKIADPLLRLNVVDAGVLHGTGWAARRLQEVAGVDKIDGLVGPVTLAAVNGAEEPWLSLRFAARRIRKLARIAAHDAKKRGCTGQIENLNGWINRSTDFLFREAELTGQSLNTGD